MFSSLKSKFRRIWYAKVKKMDGSDYTIMQLRRAGIAIGQNCRIFTNIQSREPSLITIGDRVTVSSDVEFCTHDNAIIKAVEGKTDVVGPITIGDDCFIGMRSILMYGVELGDHCIVGAGSVVTRSFLPHTVVAGNPARAVCTIEEYAAKYGDKAIDFSTIPLSSRKAFFEEHPELLVKRGIRNEDTAHDRADAASKGQ